MQMNRSDSAPLYALIIVAVGLVAIATTAALLLKALFY
jgi:hypothetical protein